MYSEYPQRHAVLYFFRPNSKEEQSLEDVSRKSGLDLPQKTSPAIEIIIESGMNNHGAN